MRGATSHQNDLTSFAFDPSGNLLATGSGTPPEDEEDFYEQGGKLVLFSVATGAPVAAIDVKPGGVGGFRATDCLVFDAAGAHLVMSHDTNAIATLDPRRGLLRVGTVYTELNEGYPAPLAVAWAGEHELFLRTHAVVPAVGDVTDHRALGRVVAQDPDWDGRIFSLGPRVAGGVALAMTMGHQRHPPALVGIDVRTCAVAYVKTVGPYVGPEKWITSPDGARTLFADEARIVLFDGPTGRDLARLDALAPPIGGVSSPRGDRFAVFGAHRTWLVDSTGSRCELPPGQLRDPWSQDLPDGAPLAFSPSDDDLVLLWNDGQLERRAGRGAVDVVFRCQVGDGEHSVRWPRPETLVTFGRRRIVFRDARDGATLAAHAW